MYTLCIILQALLKIFLILNTANVDYVPLTLAEIVFIPGANSTSCCSLLTTDDNAVENDETVSISISASSPVNIQQSSSTSLVNIQEGTTDCKSILDSFLSIDCYVFLHLQM